MRFINAIGSMTTPAEAETCNICGQPDRERDEHDAYKCRDALIELLTAERANSERLRKALELYGMHMDDCNSHQGDFEHVVPCDCGYEAALSKTGDCPSR